MEASELGLPFEPQQEVPVDWSNLPPDLVATISKRLHDLFDFVYFRAVCKKWRNATSISDLPPQFPWLLQRRDNKHLRIYSLITGKTRTIRCPKSRRMALYGPSYGHLHGDIGKRKNCLLNPLTNDEVCIKFEEDFHGHALCDGPDHSVFFDLFNTVKVGFYDLRTRQWFYVQSPLVDFCTSHSQTCFRGYYVMDTDGDNTVVTDIASRSSFSVPSPDVLNISDDVYFAESEGKLLRIVKRLDCGSVSSTFKYSFDIYQLDAIDKNCGYRWLKISRIGNQILFLGWRCSGMSIAACETAGLMGNCIYCFHICDDGNVISEVEVYRYNIEDGQTEKIPSHFNDSTIWFVPSIIGSHSVNPY